MNILLIALLASLALLIRDWVETKDFSKVKQNWKKYVGCVVGGLLFGYLSHWKFFQYIAMVAVIYLVGNSFNNVLNAANWILGKINPKWKV